jgi:transketolase
MSVRTLDDIRELAQQLRVDSIRCSTSAGSGHPTSSMSAADLMAVLLPRHFRYDWQRPDNPANDHLIFSKGHASPLLYSMFKAAGVVSDDELMTGYRRFGSTRRSPHPRAAVGRRRHWLARTGAERRRRHRPGRPVSR